MVSKLRENVQALLVIKNMNETELSAKSGVPQPTINRLLNGHHDNMYDKSVNKLAKAFGVTASELRYGNPNADNKYYYVVDNKENSNNISKLADLYKEFSLNPDLIATLSGIKEHGIITAIYTLINLPNRNDRYEALSEVIKMLENQRELCRQEAIPAPTKAKI